MNFLGRRLKRTPSDPHFRAVASVESIGENKFKFYPKALNITWGNDRRYWTIPRRDHPMRDEDKDYFAELKQVCWLEVTGSTNDELVPDKKYKVSFGVSLGPDAFGWDDCRVYIMAKIGKKGNFSFQKMDLTSIPTTTDTKISLIPISDLIVTVPQVKYNNDDDLKLYFGLYEVWAGKWKGGLRIHYALVEMHAENNDTVTINR